MDIRSSMIWNILSVMVLAATAVVLLIYGIIFIQPNIGFNVFAPEALPDKVVLITDTPTTTLAAFRTITPTIYISPTLSPTVSQTATITLTPTITNTQPTSTITLTPTITGTLPTITLTPTVSRTATRTTNPAILTDIARTGIAGTKTAAISLTNQAGTRYKLSQTAAVQLTANAAQTRTAQSITLTATFFVNTQTQAAIGTATQSFIQTATQQMAQTSTSTALTQVAVQTRTKQADLELNLPIAYSVDTNGTPDTAEQYITQLLYDGSTLFTLNMSADHPSARAATGWSMGDTNNHYLLFSDPSNLNPIYRVLYTTNATIDHLVNGLGPYIDDVVVDSQNGNFEDRLLAFSYAVGGFGTDRNIWIMRYDAVNFTPPQWANTQLTSNNSTDEHSPHWVRNSGTGYDGYIMYVARPSGAPENIRIMPGTGGASNPLTFYDSFTTRQISDPKWCTGYDWVNEEVIHRIVFGMRTSAADDWDLYLADPMELMADGTNDSIIRLTDTASTDEYSPDWSPFCNRITYIVAAGGVSNVWTANVSVAGVLSNNAALTNNSLTQMSPLWMPYNQP